MVGQVEATAWIRDSHPTRRQLILLQRCLVVRSQLCSPLMGFIGLKLLLLF